MSLTNIVVPDLGSDSQVVVIEVLVQVGDTVAADSTVVTLESDKATMDVPAGAAGTVQTIEIKVGDTVSSGKVLLTLTTAQHEPAAPAAALDAAINDSAARKEAQLTPTPQVMPEPEPINRVATTAEQVFASATAIHAGPAARRFARELGVDLATVSGTGFKQRILIADVQSYVKKQLSDGGTRSAQHNLPGFDPIPVIDYTKFGEVDSVALSRLKKLSGRNLHRNWISIPHVTQFAEADITDLLSYRHKYKDQLAQEGIKLTLLVFIMQAVVKALKKFPTFNASLDAGGEKLILKKYYHLGVAVDTPEGLVVPVIRDVNLKSISILAQELTDISAKARNKQLLPADLQGGCFSISSLGGIGGTAFTPIINAPEVAILGISIASKKPIYQANGELAPRIILPLSLSYDHRVIDGAEAARFIVYLTELLSDVRHLLL